jgi:hypothetical protein
MGRKRATQKDVDDFLDAVYQNYKALAVACFDEGHALRTATEIINEMRPLVRALAEEKQGYAVQNPLFCKHCGLSANTNTRLQLSENHKPNCPVLKAREMVKSWD